MALTQTLVQSQLQKLSPQQIQGIKLLEFPTLQLEQRIARELEDNPVLEEGERVTNDDEVVSDNTSIEEYIKAEQGASSYKLRVNNHSVNDEVRERQIYEGKSINDYLLEQLSYNNLSERQMQIAVFVVGSIDDSGYLYRSTEAIVDDIAFKVALSVDDSEVEGVIGIVQQMEPVGIGARSLCECLMLQIRALRELSSAARLALRILSSYFEEFSKRHYDIILTRTGATKDELREAIEVIMSLNPKPANGYSDEGTGSSSPVIIPDFTLSYDEDLDTFDISLGGRPLPELKINREYVAMAERALSLGGSSVERRETLDFVKGKIDSAKWFISALKQRQQTLSVTIRAIVDFQRAYFIDGESSLLRPMILRDIAELTGFDISTISRVVNSKYLETHFGTFLLKYFFSEGVLNDSGEEVSTREIKRLIGESIIGESKSDPLTDEALMLMLHDKGFKIARRTVAKYRESMNIAVARLRREL